MASSTINVKLDAKQMEYIRTECMDAIARLQAERDELREAVDAVEWVMGYDGDLFCPWCDKWIEDGHAGNCQRQRALAKE
jgi:hypothetical protein